MCPTYAGAAWLLVLEALLASSVPAWRATAVDPLIALAAISSCGPTQCSSERAATARG